LTTGGGRPPAPPLPVYGHEGWSEQIFTYTCLLAVHDNPTQSQKFRLYLYLANLSENSISILSICVKFGANRFSYVQVIDV